MKKRRSAFSAKTVAPIEPPQKKPAMDAQKSGKKKNKKKNKQETVSANVELYTGTSQTEIEPVIVGSENRDEEMDAMKAIFAKAAKQKVEKSRLAGKIEPESLQSDNNHESGDETFDSDVPSTSEEPSASPKKSKLLRPPTMPIPTSVSDSLKDSARLFQWMIWPMDVEDFMLNYWDKKPILIRRNKADYNSSLFSTSQLANIIQNNPVQFGVNLDVTSWDKQHGRQTHNEPGRAWPSKVWDLYNNGCSVRMLNPQTYSKSVWSLCAGLQEFFGCFTGSNSYLTPPSTTGFAPHYDDVEVFMVQTEGRKRWKVWKPFDNSHLPRKSSRNYHPNEIKGEPEIYEIVQPGDVLYVPRGWIHQGECLCGEHSLHVTISTYQKNAWCDLLEKIVPQALSTAIKEDVEFRRGLPTDYKLIMGVSNSDREDRRVEREQFSNVVMSLMQNMIQYADIDTACDQLAANDTHCALPPVLSKDEMSRTVQWGKPIVENGVVKNTCYKLDENTEIRLLRQQSARVIMSDEGKISLCHSNDNPRVYKKEELKAYEIDEDAAAVFDVLTGKYPAYTAVGELATETCDLDSTLQIVLNLLENNVVMTKEVTRLYNETDEMNI